ncbi:hypothetical protein [Burkholderia pseudomallei]|uniref:hypothetical protein n=1 Tax=Burkholderia pseudomallei TaxID=28450 RepID=UPI000ABD7553|nr:hypothetical protein [Burkholderia pseudomallei]
MAYAQLDSMMKSNVSDLRTTPFRADTDSKATMIPKDQDWFSPGLYGSVHAQAANRKRGLK